jgi:hypothetical protein
MTFVTPSWPYGFPRPWRCALYAAIAFFVFANLMMVAIQGALILRGSDAIDFETYRAAVARFADGSLYASAEWWYGWRYSPVAVALCVPSALIGETAWRLLHFVGLVGLPGWPRLFAAVSYPFWFDVAAGNVMIFVVVAAYWAVRGNRFAIAASFILALLIPRPLMLPLVAWLLWRHPRARWPFAAMFGLHAIAVIGTGYGPEWLAVLLAAGSEVASDVNTSPSAIIGLWWLVVAIPAAVWALLRDRPATAGLVLQPYWLPYYLLMPFADRWPPLLVYRRFRQESQERR